MKQAVESANLIDQLRKMEARLLALKALGAYVDLDLARVQGSLRTIEVRLVIRGFLGRVRQFEKRVDIPMEELETILPALAEEHASAMAAGLISMIEIEFLDEPNPEARFFRIGTEPAGMVMPLRIDLGESDAG